MKKTTLLLMFLILVGVAQAAYYSIGEDGLLSYWEFGSNYTDYYRLNNGTAYGDTILKAGYMGNSAWFDGVDDYVNITNYNIYQDSNRNNFTIAFFMRKNTTGVNQNDRVWLARNTTNSMVQEIYVGDSTNGATVFVTGGTSTASNLRTLATTVANEWEFITYTWDGATASLYKNGTLLNASTYSAKKFVNMGQFITLARWDTNSLDGSIDELSFWNRALSAAEINGMYQNYTLGYRPYNITSTPTPLTEIYLAVNGSDLNNGSIDYPFRTFNYSLSMLQDNGTLYIRGGTYFVNNGSLLTSKTWTSPTLITNYNGESVLIRNSYEGLEQKTTTWTNLTNSTACIWRASVTASGNASMYYNATNQTLYQFKSDWSDWMASTSPRQGFMWADPTNYIYYKDVDNRSCNPNTISFMFSTTTTLQIGSVGSNLKIQGLNFVGGYRGIYMTSSNNVTINNTQILSTIPLDIRSSGNLTITNNKLMSVYGNWSWTQVKTSYMEKWLLYIKNGGSGINISYNYLDGNYNGIGLESDTQQEFKNIDVGFNVIKNIPDDALELEDYASCGYYHDNNISDSFVGISVSPTNSTQCPSLLTRNTVESIRNEWYSGTGTFGTGECYKILDPSAFEWFNVTQSTCIGRGIYGTTTSREQINVTWKDNLFYSPLTTNGRCIDRSGLQADGIHYDYNNYWRVDGLGIFRYWNSETNDTEYTTLAAAKAAQPSLLWDVNSLNIEPNFVNYTAGDYRLYSPSLLCNSSSTGSYIGALPCVAYPTPTYNETVSTFGNYWTLNLTFLQKPYFLQFQLNNTNTNPKTIDYQKSAFYLDCDAGISDCSNANDGDESTSAEITSTYAYYNQRMTKAFQNYANYSDNDLRLRTYLRYYNGAYTISCKTTTGETSIYALTDDYAGWHNKEFNISIPESCRLSNVTVYYDFINRFVSGSFFIYESQLYETYPYYIQMEGVTIFNSTSEANSSYSFNLTNSTYDINSVADTFIQFIFAAGYQNTFGISYYYDYVYNKSINVSIYQNGTTTLIYPTCTFNGASVTPSSQLLYFNSSLENTLRCSKVLYTNLSYAIVPLYNSINLSMNPSDINLNITIKDEETNSIITNQTLFIDIISESVSHNYSTSNGTININDFPREFLEIRYGGGEYATRSYFTTITENTSLTLYTVKTANSSLIEFTVTDERGQAVTDAYLKVQRYFVSESAWKLVGMERVDGNGVSGMYLVPYTIPYIFIVEKDGSVVYTSSSSGTKIFTTPINLRAAITTDVLESFRKLSKYLTTSLSFNNETKVVTYFFNDASGIVVEGCLDFITESLVRKIVNTTCVSTNSGTIVFNASSMINNNSKFSAVGYVETNTPYSKTITDTLTDMFKYGLFYQNFGKNGLFFAYIFIATMFFLGMFVNFPTALLYTVVSLVVVQLIGIGFFGWSLIITITIIGLFFAGSSKMGQ